MRRVAVVGTGYPKHKSRWEEEGLTGLVYLAATEALEDAGLEPADIEAVVYGSSPELLTGINHPEKWCSEASFSVGKPQFRIHTGGTVGASTGIAAFYFVASGMFDIVLAVTGDKNSESPVQYGLSTVYDPIIGRQFACGAPSAVALQALEYMYKFGATEEHGAKIAVKNRINALRNPKAHLHIEGINLEMVRNSPMIASPIRLLDACPASDGAAAMIFVSEEVAKKLSAPKAWVNGVSAVTEGVMYVDRDMTDPIALKKAAKTAYTQAGVTNPFKEIDVAELYEAFSYQEMIWYEGLGFCERGEGMKLIDEGSTFMKGIDYGFETPRAGELPVNPSGGVLSSNNIGSTAMIRQIEASMQVRDKAGEHQVDGARVALAHGWGGGIQFHTVMILGREPA